MLRSCHFYWIKCSLRNILITFANVFLARGKYNVIKSRIIFSKYARKENIASANSAQYRISMANLYLLVTYSYLKANSCLLSKVIDS